MAQEDNFESTKFEELEKKLDHYVFTIVMSQSLCSSFYDRKNAEFDFRRLKTLFDSVSILFKKSRNFVLVRKGVTFFWKILFNFKSKQLKCMF